MADSFSTSYLRRSLMSSCAGVEASCWGLSTGRIVCCDHQLLPTRSHHLVFAGMDLIPILLVIAWIQVVVNFSASEGPAQEVVTAIKEAGGDAIAVGADISKQEDINRHVLLLPALVLLIRARHWQSPSPSAPTSPIRSAS